MGFGDAVDGGQAALGQPGADLPPQFFVVGRVSHRASLLLAGHAGLHFLAAGLPLGLMVPPRAGVAGPRVSSPWSPPSPARRSGEGRRGALLAPRLRAPEWPSSSR
jgi:hypothetical protein